MTSETGGAGTLQRWCERMGIAPAFEDIWSHRHEASEAALRGLLAELGVADVSDAALAAAEAADWAEILPPVVCATTGVPGVAVEVRVPASVASVRWRIVEEGGALREGGVDVTDGVIDRRATVAGIERLALRLRIPGLLAPGYHRLEIEFDAQATQATQTAQATLVVAPERCYRPPSLQGDGRVWGPALQLYSLRSERNWGIGDFGDLARLAGDFGAAGAGLVGLNPLHALFPHDPNHRSPYSPSSRLQLNVIYVDVEAVAELQECAAARTLLHSDAFQARLAALRAAPHVDYPGVAAAKSELLELLYAHFRAQHLERSTPRGLAFRSWRAERGVALEWHATFEALQERFHRADAGVWGWPVWPAEFRDAGSDAVRAFQRDEAARIAYFAWLQWLADEQLGAVAAACRERGLAVGLYLDLAVSVDRAGSDCWSHAALYAPGASVGAPPDALSLGGQDWGLPPFTPRALVDDRLAFFRDTLRACMRHAGALRIDHVMGLMRLYWIAPGRPASDGAYVHYPLRGLMAVVALESERNRCMVIGEDLGTVAEEMRAALARHELLSYRLLYFTRDADGAFEPPPSYPREALVAVGTHDLPTLAGWWQGHDIEVRHDVGLYPDAAVEQAQRDARADDRARLLVAIEQAGLLPHGMAVDPVPPLTAPLLEAVHAFVASTPSRVMVMQLEDALGVIDQANLPGTVDQHPNWCQKLPLTVESIADDAQVQGLCAVLARVRPHPRADDAGAVRAIVPGATYRLQFHAGFTFDDATAILPYLERLGVSHVYCSPLTRARPGSLHGYDVVAFDEINPELGGFDGFERFSDAARALGLGLVLDFVPNHMGVGPDNAWWVDVLENGRASAWAGFFDIAWNPVDPDLAGKVLLPVLGQHVGQVLAAGELKPAFEPAQGRFVLRYWEHAYPLEPRSTAPLLQRALVHLDDAGDATEEERAALHALAWGFSQLPGHDATDAKLLERRRRSVAPLRARLAELATRAPSVLAAIERAVAGFAAPDAVDALHEAQAYRLAFWRVAADEINYRRFFDINELAALRMEDPAVFEATHGLVLGLAAAGRIDGVRLDHTDGLHDPAQYFERLQKAFLLRRAPALAAREDRPRRPLYVVAEKIAAGHEDVPESWAIHGTTGYRFANVVNGVLVDTATRDEFDRVWREFGGETDDFAEMAWRGKHEVMRDALASELTSLSAELLRIARAHRAGRDYTGRALRDVLTEIAACMPVYRTYIVDAPSMQDQRLIDEAVAQACRRAPDADPGIVDFVHATLLAQVPPDADAAQAERVRRFAMRFQQFTSPVAAKGVEDTAFYRYTRLLSLNEVGGEPGQYGFALDEFHAANADRASRWPHTLIATSTHDTKRSEDVRCRLDVLSETPSAWHALLQRLEALPQPQARPSRADMLMIFQTLLGTLPVGGLTEETLAPYRERIEQYVLKCIREAKRHTSWVRPDAPYEDAALGVVRGLLGRVDSNPALAPLQAQAEVLARAGAFNSASLVVLKNTAPGVPDLYQGNELMDLSLVDPDNRRPVDYALRARLLDELAAGVGAPTVMLAELLRTPHDGRLKLWVSWRLLQLRRALAAPFRDGGYEPLQAAGRRERHVVAFARGGQGGVPRIVTIVGRFYAGLQGLPIGAATWGDTSVQVPADWDGAVLIDALTNEAIRVVDGRVALARVFAALPFAVLSLAAGNPQEASCLPA